MATVCPSMPSGSYLVLCDLRVPKRKPRKASVLKGGRRSGGFVAFWRGRNSRVPVYIGSPQVLMFVPTNGSHLGCIISSACVCHGAHSVRLLPLHPVSLWSSSRMSRAECGICRLLEQGGVRVCSRLVGWPIVALALFRRARITLFCECFAALRAVDVCKRWC